MWIARDKDGTLTAFKDKPERQLNKYWGPDGFHSRDWKSLWQGFEDLTWEDEPIEIPNDYFGFQMF